MTSPSQSQPRHAPYSVGYGRPPLASRFRKGQSGNPNGRPRGGRGKAEAAARAGGLDAMQVALLAVLDEEVEVAGRRRRMSQHEAVWRALLARAIEGDVRAAKLLVEAGREVEAARRAVRGDEPGVDVVALARTMRAVKLEAAAGVQRVPHRGAEHEPEAEPEPEAADAPQPQPEVVRAAARVPHDRAAAVGAAAPAMPCAASDAPSWDDKPAPRVSPARNVGAARRGAEPLIPNSQPLVATGWMPIERCSDTIAECKPPPIGSGAARTAC